MKINSSCPENRKCCNSTFDVYVYLSVHVAVNVYVDEIMLELTWKVLTRYELAIVLKGMQFAFCTLTREELAVTLKSILGLQIGVTDLGRRSRRGAVGKI